MNRNNDDDTNDSSCSSLDYLSRRSAGFRKPFHSLYPSSRDIKDPPPSATDFLKECKTADDDQEPSNSTVAASYDSGDDVPATAAPVTIHHSPSQSKPMIEIAPGCFKDLRGAQETLKYMSSNRCQRVKCVACDQDLLCVDDCEMVICSKCRLVSPLSSTNGKVVYGVGLGLSQDMR